MKELVCFAMCVGLFTTTLPMQLLTYLDSATLCLLQKVCSTDFNGVVSALAVHLIQNFLRLQAVWWQHSQLARAISQCQAEQSAVRVLEAGCLTVSA